MVKNINNTEINKYIEDIQQEIKKAKVDIYNLKNTTQQKPTINTIDKRKEYGAFVKEDKKTNKKSFNIKIVSGYDLTQWVVK